MDPDALKRMLVEKWFALRMAMVDNEYCLDAIDLAAGRDPLAARAICKSQAEAAWAELDSRTLTVESTDIEGEAILKDG